MKADGRAQRKEEAKWSGGGGGVHWLGAQLCVGAKPWLTCEPNYGVERQREEKQEVEGVWGGMESRSVLEGRGLVMLWGRTEGRWKVATCAQNALVSAAGLAHIRLKTLYPIKVLLPVFKAE